MEIKQFKSGSKSLRRDNITILLLKQCSYPTVLEVNEESEGSISCKMTPHYPVNEDEELAIQFVEKRIRRSWKYCC